MCWGHLQLLAHDAGHKGSNPEAPAVEVIAIGDAGNGVAIAGKQTAGKPTKAAKPSTAAAKRASGKAAAKDQRGIMSFFGKK